MCVRVEVVRDELRRVAVLSGAGVVIVLVARCWSAVVFRAIVVATIRRCYFTHMRDDIIHLCRNRSVTWMCAYC